MAEEEPQPKAGREIEDYLKAGIRVCRETAMGAGVDGDGLRKATKKCSIEWLKAEEYRTEHRFAARAAEVFAKKFDEYYGEKPVKEESE